MSVSFEELELSYVSSTRLYSPTNVPTVLIATVALSALFVMDTDSYRAELLPNRRFNLVVLSSLFDSEAYVTVIVACFPFSISINFGRFGVNSATYI